MQQLLGSVGRRTTDSFNQITELFALTHRIVRQILLPSVSANVVVRRITVEQIYFTAVQALPIIIPVAVILGSMIIIQFSKFLGQIDLGRIAVLIILRELGPILTALLIVMRSATAVTVEVSYMNVFHELEAIEMAGVDPFRIVCVPRLIGITTAVVCLFIVFDIAAILGGYALVWIGTYINLAGYLRQIADAVSAADIIVGVIKALLFGITITVTCLYHALRATQHITQIPVAVSRASVQCFLYCIAVNIFVSVLFYL